MREMADVTLDREFDDSEPGYGSRFNHQHTKNMDYPTPLTDAELKSNSYYTHRAGKVYGAFAKCLERDRAKLYKALKKMCDVEDSCAIDPTEEDWTNCRKLLGSIKLR